MEASEPSVGGPGGRRPRGRWLRPLAALTCLGLLAAAAAVPWWRSHNIGPVERGARLAAAKGCLSCHGPGGQQADPDGSARVGSVPSFEHDDVTMYSRSRQEIREWIEEGRPRRLASEEAAAHEGGHDHGVLRMPAWGKRLRDDELEDLVAYVAAVSDFEPVPDEVVKGRATAARLGCFACHGPQGRGDPPNPGSLKGYIPSWSGADFPELARDDGEIREWIRDGAPRRLRTHPIAGWFLRRQQIRMPAYGDRVNEDEIVQITGYILWLRRSPAR